MKLHNVITKEGDEKNIFRYFTSIFVFLYKQRNHILEITIYALFLFSYFRKFSMAIIHFHMILFPIYIMNFFFLF